ADGQTGILTAANGLVVSTSNAFDAARKLEFDLNGGLLAGTNYDQVNVIGSVNLGNDLARPLANTPGTISANPGGPIASISNDGTTDPVNGHFFTIDPNDPQQQIIDLPDTASLTINGQPFWISYLGVPPPGNGPRNDNDVVLIRNSPSMFPNRSVTPVLTE